MRRQQNLVSVAAAGGNGGEPHQYRHAAGITCRSSGLSAPCRRPDRGSVQHRRRQPAASVSSTPGRRSRHLWHQTATTSLPAPAPETSGGGVARQGPCATASAGRGQTHPDERRQERRRGRRRPTRRGSTGRAQYGARHRLPATTGSCAVPSVGWSSRRSRRMGRNGHPASARTAWRSPLPLPHVRLGSTPAGIAWWWSSGGRLSAAELPSGDKSSGHGQRAPPACQPSVTGAFVTVPTAAGDRDRRCQEFKSGEDPDPGWGRTDRLSIAIALSPGAKRVATAVNGRIWISSIAKGLRATPPPPHAAR
jgi:hypothetical protein